MYTETYGYPEYAHSVSFVVTTPEEPVVTPTPVDPVVTPTTPPHVAPTVPPKSEESNDYCGDGSCNNGDTCSSCPVDCGLCNPYSCSPQHCALPSCLCARTTHPTVSDPANTPQFVTITWDDAQTPTTFSSVMNVARSTAVGVG